MKIIEHFAVIIFMHILRENSTMIIAGKFGPLIYL